MRNYAVTSLFSVAIWTVQLALYLVDPGSEALPEGRAQALLIMLVVSFFVSAVSYGLWEADHGTAFSYFFPLHGAQRVAEHEWRFGVFARANFVSLLTVLVLSLVFTHSYPSFTIRGVPVLTPITGVQLLLYSVAQSFVGMTLLLYAAAGQFYVRNGGVKRTPH